MKGYKATYNGICRGFKFEVGETYKHDGEAVLCENGFHFCKRAFDTLNYYGYGKDFVLFEVEAKAVDSENDKCVTDKIKILRRVPKKEYFKLLKIKLDRNGEISYRETPYGSKFYYKGGFFHRKGGPAVEYSDGTKYWYKNGKSHRDDGPAVELTDGTKKWYIDDIRLSEEEFNELTGKVT